MEKKISKTSTKDQILQAYEELLKKQQEKSHDNIKEIQQRKEAEKTVQSAATNTESKILKEISSLKENFLNSLELVQESLLKEYTKLAEIQDAIKIEKKNLEELYGLSANADSFAAILTAQKESRESFEKEMALEKEKWAKEKESYLAAVKEKEAEWTKSRKREEEEYNYTLAQKRKKENDDYELKKAKLESELKEKKKEVEKEFEEREKNIAATEAGYEALRKASENFPKELEKAVQQSNKELEQKLNSEFNYREVLNAKEMEGQIKLRDLQITTLENKIKELETQIKQLSQKAETSEKSVKDIALKAIESSSGKIHFIEKEVNKKE